MITVGDLIEKLGGKSSDYSIIKYINLSGVQSPASRNGGDWFSTEIMPEHWDQALGQHIIEVKHMVPPEGWFRGRVDARHIMKVRKHTFGAIIVLSREYNNLPFDRRVWFEYEADAIEGTLMSN